MSSLESSFWRFSTALYQATDVEKICIALQDQRGVDVNMLLYTLWAGVEGSSLNAADFDRLERLTSPWRESVVKPLRAARRALKQPQPSADVEATAALRERVAAVELEAERIQQEMLFSQPRVGGDGPAHDPRALAISNVKRLLTWRGQPNELTDQEALAVLDRALVENPSHLRQY